MIGRCWITVLVGFFSLLVSLPTPSAHSQTSAQSSSCGVLSYGARVSCYAPSERSRAERLFPVRPIDPSSIVFHSIGLKLTRVVVYERLFGLAKPFAIEYDFGSLPPSWQGAIPRPLDSRARILVVSEVSPMHLYGLWRISRTVGHLPNGAPRYDPWHFYAHHLDVGGTAARLQIERIGRAIISSSH